MEIKSGRGGKEIVDRETFFVDQSWKISIDSRYYSKVIKGVIWSMDIAETFGNRREEDNLTGDARRRY